MRGVARIEGLEDLGRKLKALPDKIASRVMQSALIAGGRVIAKEYSRRAAGLNKTPIAERPKDRRRPGTLARAVRVARDRYASRGVPGVSVYIRRGKSYQAGKTMKGRKKANAKSMDGFYFPWVEFGHAIVARGAKSARGGIARRRKAAALKGGRVTAYPVLGPVFAARREAAVRAVRDYAGRRIQRVIDQG